MSEQAVTFLRTLNNIVYSLSLTEALSILDAALLINPAVFDWNAATLEQKVAEASAAIARLVTAQPRRVLRAGQGVAELARQFVDHRQHEQNVFVYGHGNQRYFYA